MKGESKLTKIKELFGKVTIEPLLFIYYMSLGFEGPTVSGLWYWKCCMILHQNEWICDNINLNETLEELESEVQVMNSKWNFYDDLCKSIPSMMMTLFLYGAVSDHISRKLPIMLPMVANIISLTIQIFCSIYAQSSLGYLLLASLIEGFSGSIGTLFMAVMSYVSDVSSLKSRAIRISVAYGSMNAGQLISSTISGVLLENTSFKFVFLICISLNFVSLVYLFFGFPDVNNNKKLEKLSEVREVVICDVKADSNITSDQSMEFKNNTISKSKSEKTDLSKDVKMCVDLESKSEKSSIDKDINENTFFSTERFKVPFRVTFKLRKDNNRFHILMILLAFGIQTFNIIDREISYLFLKKPPISFTQAQYGYYSGYNNVLKLFTMFAIIPILKKKFGFWDSLMLCLAMFSYIIDYTIMGVSVNKWMVCLAPLFGILANGCYTFGRSMLSSMVDVTEIGTIFSVLSLILNVMGIFRSAFYSFFLYPATIDFYPGFSYLFGAFLLIIPSGISMWIHRDIKKQQQQKKQSQKISGQDTEL